MIENPPLLTIRRNFPRPTAEELAAFANSPTGHLVDSMNGRGALAYKIKPVSEACRPKPEAGLIVPAKRGPPAGICGRPFKVAMFAALVVVLPKFEPGGML